MTLGATKVRIIYEISIGFCGLISLMTSNLIILITFAADNRILMIK
jgi:hypothetical protein